MRVLIIDDDPVRAIPVLKAGHDVKIAHGFDQIDFWLKCKHWYPEIICLDHDMPQMPGLEVVGHFVDELWWRTVRIWSCNHIAAPIMKDHLLDAAKAEEMEGIFDVHILSFDSKTEPAFWRAQGNKS